MLRERVQTRMFVALLVVMTFVAAPLSALGQKTSPVAPTKAQVEAVVREAYEKFKSDAGGKNADYIPYLAQVDSKLFGIAIVTTDNQILTMGDISYSFSIQSISKVFSQALAMEELGPDKVFEKVGSEPTGRAFNSVFAVADMPTHTGNPYVNAGAISTVSLISGKTADEKWNKILDFYSRVAGEKLKLIDEVYKSEAATNTGNKALSMLLAKYDRIYADPFESVDVYTKQCSVGVNVAQLQAMNSGVDLTKTTKLVVPNGNVRLTKWVRATNNAGAATEPTTGVNKVRARKGDTIARIAAGRNLDANDVARLNGIPVDAELKAGQEIKIPATTTTSSRRR